MMPLYKICTAALWQETQASGVFRGMPVDLQDGYIHLSTAEQTPETARKYFAGMRGLVLLTVDGEQLGAALRFEPSSSASRPGDFPHLYGQLPLSAIVEAKPFGVPALAAAT